MSYGNPLPRRLRQASTPAEHRLWEHLRGRRLDAKFRRQHPIGPYVVDFACVEARLVVELQGGVHRLREVEDELRAQAIEADSWCVLAFTNEAVFDDLPSLLDAIRTALRHPPSP